jgi:hypothetical protein
MKKTLVLINIYFLFVIDCTRVNHQLKPLVPSEDGYTGSIIVDEYNPEQYQMFWKLLSKTEIQFELHCKTNGWVGWGISNNGGMTGKC